MMAEQPQSAWDRFRYAMFHGPMYRAMHGGESNPSHVAQGARIGMAAGPVGALLGGIGGYLYDRYHAGHEQVPLLTAPGMLNYSPSPDQAVESGGEGDYPDFSQYGGDSSTTFNASDVNNPYNIAASHSGPSTSGFGMGWGTISMGDLNEMLSAGMGHQSTGTPQIAGDIRMDTGGEFQAKRHAKRDAYNKRQG